MKRGIEKDFFRKPYKETLIAIVNKFGDVSSRLLGYLDACCTYHNEIVVLPPAKEIARIIGCGLSTIYNAFTKIEEKCNFFRIQLSGTHILAYRTDPDDPKNFFDFKNQEYIPTQKNYFSKYRKDSQKQEKQSPEPLPDIDPASPQTIQTDHTPQTGGQVDEKINKEEPEEKVEVKVKKEKVKGQEFSPLPGHQPKKKNPPAVTQKKYDVDKKLLERLRMCEIQVSEEILVKIEQHHISQAYGAITHVENTFETIRDPKAVFLYQLPRQPIEKLGKRYSDELLMKQKQELQAIDEQKKDPQYFVTAKKAFEEAKKKLLQKNTMPRGG